MLSSAITLKLASVLTFHSIRGGSNHDVAIIAETNDEQCVQKPVTKDSGEI